MNRKRACVFGILAGLWIAILFMLSTQSGVDSGQLSEGITEKLFGWLIARGVPEATLEHIVRKLAHFSGFALSGFFTGMALFSVLKKRTAGLAAFGIEALMAVLNELSQMIPVGRSCSVKDMLIDLSGATLGILIAWWTDRHLGSKKGKA